MIKRRYRARAGIRDAPPKEVTVVTVHAATGPLEATPTNTCSRDSTGGDVGADTDCAGGDATAEATDTVDANGNGNGNGNGSAETEPVAASRKRVSWPRVAAYAILPALALTLTIAVGALKYLDSSARDDQIAAVESVQVAKDSTVAMLSYQPDAVDQQLHNARDLLTGTFRDSYTSLINDVVIPGAKQKQISATATVPAAAPVMADSRHAVVLVFVNQTVVVGSDAPADTTSAIRVTLDKTGGRWLVSQFDPI
jgi:Mce-associated membrane protein